MATAPRSARDCFAEAAEAAGRPMSRDALEFYFERANARINRYVREGMTQEGAAMRAGKELGDEAAVARAVEKRAARFNMLAQEGLNARVIPGRDLDSVLAVIDGVQRRGAFKDAALSLNAMGGQRVRSTVNAFFHELRDAGMDRAFKKADPAFERDVANELGRIDDPTWGRDTGNAQAKKMAEIIHKHQDALRLAENDAGAFVGKLDQYLARQTHNRAKIIRAGEDAWIEAIRPKLAAKTFDDLLPDEIDGFLRQTYRNLATGIHTGSEQGGWIAGFKGPANLAKKLSAERKLFFESPDAWMDYNREFGNGSLNGTVLSTLERGARAVEAMQLLGTNPRAMLNGWLDNLAVKARDEGRTADATLLSQQKERMLRLYDHAMRNPRPIENEKTAAFFASLRSFQRFKLGGAAISSIPDLSSTATMAQHNGLGALESLSWHLGQLFPDSAGRKAAMREANIGWDHMAQSLQTRFGAEDGVPGALAKTVDTFSRLTALPWWTQNMKDASTLMLLHNTAEKAGLEHAALPRRMQTTLRRFGIEQPEWDALRQVAQKAPDGNRYIFAGDIADLPDSAVAHLAGYGTVAQMTARKTELEQALIDLFKHGHKQAPGAKAAEYRAEIAAIEKAADKGRAILQKKYSTYVFDNVQEGMSEETASVRDLMSGKGSAGELSTEAWRTVMQFKQFPASFMARSVMREWSRDGVDVSGMAKLIAGTTLFGYLAMSAKDMLRGKEPFNPANPGGYDAGQYSKNVMRAMVQGGGLGIYGDFLLGEVSRTGGGPVTSMLGPAVGMANDLANALIVKPREAALKGELSAGRFAADAFQAAKNNAPFINLFWTRTALDYGVLYSLQETLNPGYLARYEQNTQKSTGQQFLLSPSRDHLQTFGR